MNPARLLPAIEKLKSWKRYRLVLLVGPAGSGKTAFLRKWTQEMVTGFEGELLPRVVWIDLGPEQDNPKQFLESLYSAFSLPPPSLLESPLHFDAGMAELTNRLAGLPAKTLLVLDHYHHITSPAVNEAVARFLDFPPQGTHLVIAARQEPPLPIPRLRARRQLLEIRLEELQAS